MAMSKESVSVLLIPFNLTRRFLFILALPLTFFSGLSFADSLKIAESTVFSYDGPEIRSKCIGYLKTKTLPKKCHVSGWKISCPREELKTCSEWKTQLKRHGQYIVMYGPAGMDPHQADVIGKSCFTSGLAAGLAVGTLAYDSVAALFTSKRPILETTMRACIETTEGLGKIYTKDFHLSLESRDFWPK